jgi:hypothetical protein
MENAYIWRYIRTKKRSTKGASVQHFSVVLKKTSRQSEAKGVVKVWPKCFGVSGRVRHKITFLPTRTIVVGDIGEGGVSLGSLIKCIWLKIAWVPAKYV